MIYGYEQAEDSKKEEEKVQDPIPRAAFECTGGVDPYDMDKKDYLTAFANGPCNPVVVLPGISGSKLVVAIDCPIMKKYSPDLFSICGWAYCSMKGDVDNGFAPNKEYEIWIPGMLSPMSIATTMTEHKNCFSGIVGFSVTQDESGKFVFTEPKGVKVTIVGESPLTKTKKASNCAFDAIEDMLPLPFQPTKANEYFKNMRIAYEAAGYISGFTLQALPYDWRYAYEDHSLNTKFDRVISTMQEMMTKKVVIVAHSMGNYQVLHNLWKLPQSWKDKNVARYIAIAPPYLGSPRTLLNPIGMDDELQYSIMGITVGINPDMFLQTVANFPSIYQLMPIDTFKRFQNEPWMKAILQRIKEEKNTEPISKGSIMDLFPSYTKSCNPGFKERPKGCYTGLNSMWDFGKVVDDELTPDSMKSLFDKYSYNKLASALLTEATDPRFENLDNTGVQVNIIYSSNLNTMASFNYKNNPKPVTEQPKFYPPDSITEEMGDGVVLTTSAIVPGIKWADEFNNKLGGSKPVNFIEMCSDYQRRTSVFDDPFVKKVAHNGYFGVKCGCRGLPWVKVKGEGCNHSGMIVDPYLIDFVLESSIDGVTGIVGSTFVKMNQSEVEEYLENCNLFEP